MLITFLIDMTRLLATEEWFVAATQKLKFWLFTALYLSYRILQKSLLGTKLMLSSWNSLVKGMQLVLSSCRVELLNEFMQLLTISSDSGDSSVESSWHPSTVLLYFGIRLDWISLLPADYWWLRSLLLDIVLLNCCCYWFLHPPVVIRLVDSVR
jgi:hypothetical protein